MLRQIMQTCAECRATGFAGLSASPAEHPDIRRQALNLRPSGGAAGRSGQGGPVASFLYFTPVPRVRRDPASLTRQESDSMKSFLELLGLACPKLAFVLRWIQVKRKLVFVNRYFYPDHSATSQMLSDLAFGLAADGDFEVHVVTSRQRYDDPASRLPEFEYVRGVAVHRVWTSRFGRNNLWGRVVDYGSFYGSSARALYRLADSRSILVAKTDPPLISVVAAGIAKLRGAGLVNWIQDVFPEVAEALGLQVARGPWHRWPKWLRNQSLKNADANIAIGDLMKGRLLGEGVSGQKIAVIHNWADEAGITPVSPEQNALRKEWGLDGRFVVGYSGNLGRGHEFDTLLEAAEALRNNAEIVFLVIGGGANLAAVREAVASRKLGNFVFKPYQPREILSASLSAADVHLVSLRPELEGLIVPSKFYGIAAAGRPVLFIGAPDGEIARILGQANCGFSVKPGDSKDLAGRVLEMAGNPRAVEAMGHSARQLFEIRFGMRAALKAWRAILANLGEMPGEAAVSSSDAVAKA
jgi:colanic acid biosynthesis glycosyl transferase WcaI